MKTKVVADYTPVERPDLFQGQDRTFYQVTPVKGANVEGVIAVGMSSQTVKDWPQRYDKTTVPAMWVDLTPQLADEDGRASSEALTFTVNRKVYQHDYRARAHVKFIPRADDDHRDEYYRRVTVAGQEYYLSGHVDAYDAFSDSARTAIQAVIEAIAAEYVTGERWHAKRVEMAESVVAELTREAVKAENALAKAENALEALRNETV